MSKKLTYDDLFPNSVILEDLDNITQNMKGLLHIEDSIHYNNCKNVIINSDGKINRLSFDIEKSNNVKAFLPKKLLKIFM